ncbi:MAG TPA: outer membrane beta-barrel protein [Xanthobacteraceae bacterium]
MRGLAACAVVLAALAFCGAAKARDLPGRATPPEEIPPGPYDFNGMYFGVTLGVANGSSTQSASTGDLTPAFDLTGGTFGLTLGYNVQAGKIIYGVESDISVSTLRGSSGYLGAPPGFTTESSERWISTYRLRAGYSLSQTWMAYVTGGGATAAVKIIATEPGAGVAWESQVRTGWTVGGGIEAGRVRSFAIKLEYLYVDFGNPSFFNPPPAPGFFNRAGGVRLHENIFRIGLNHKFNGL